jgi:hypothetical protein
MTRVARRVVGAAFLAVAVVLAGGCATLPPPRPITAAVEIAGQWRGYIQFGRGPLELFYLTLQPDGGLVAAWDGITRWGTVRLEGNRVRFSFYVWSGDLQYFEGDGQRVIILREDFMGFYAHVTPLS